MTFFPLSCRTGALRRQLRKRRSRRSRTRFPSSLQVEPLECRALLATQPILLADVFPGSDSSSPSVFVDVDGTAFFTAEDGEHGIELWKSDGTANGTVLVKDIDGPDSASYPANLTNVDGILFFTANDGEHGEELWKSDGTESGTALVKDIQSTDSNGFPATSYPANLTNVDGVLFFTADDGEHGTELWKSDGTEQGTVLVKDIRTGDTYGYPATSLPANLTNVDGVLFFTANDGENGSELWKSDGTADGTVLVKDINPAAPYGYPYSSSPSNLTHVNGTLFFTADDGENGFELWKSDGTADGTVIVKDINPTASSPYPGGPAPLNLTDVDGTLFFTADDGESGLELWNSDGTESGTVLVKDIRPGEGTFYFNDGAYDYGYREGPYPSSPQDLTAVQRAGQAATLFFTADDGVNGRELWKSDGTQEGTVLVADLHPGEEPSYFYYLTDVDGTLFFSGEFDEDSGDELWSSDGSESGTILVADIFPGESGSYSTNLSNVNGKLFFSSTDEDQGIEPWVVESGILVKGTVFVDLDANGRQDEAEPGLAEFTIFLDENGNGQLDASEPQATTDSNGVYRFAVQPGAYTIRSQPASGFRLTSPSDPASHSVTVDETGTDERFDFVFQLSAPASIDLVAETDTGAANDDNITSFNNSSADSALQFVVSDVAEFAFVRLFVDGEPRGVVVAREDTVTITTDGANTLSDGTHIITATQVLPGSGLESESSPSLILTVDSTAPAEFNSTAPSATVFGELFVYDPISPEANTPGVAWSLQDAPEGMTIGPDGVVTWTPTLDQQGPQSFEIRLTDAAGNSVSQSVDLTVLGIIPAFPDSYSLNEDVVLSIGAPVGVLANDGDDTHGPLATMVAVEPSHGSLQLMPDGSFVYTPDPDFFGTDEFTYFASDGFDVSNEALVTFTVVPTNDPPKANDDSYEVDEDRSIAISPVDGVLSNDSDDGDADIRGELVENVTNGILTFSEDGSFTYSPGPNFSGVETFTYRAIDDLGASSVATVTINVRPTNDLPVARADTYDINEDETLTRSAEQGVLANDGDPDGDKLDANVVDEPTQGTLSLQTDGSFTYTPRANFFGVDRFTYQLSDGVGLSDVVTVTVNVASQPDAPNARDDQFEVMKDDELQRFDVLANDTTDPDDAQPITVISVTQGTAGGEVNIADDNMEIEYRPPDGFSGKETFTYTLRDSDGLTDEATVTITVSDFVPNSIAGFVYIDTDGDGTHDTTEMGVPGTLVTLTGIDDQGGTVASSVLTPDDGSYLFTDLRPGSYTITQQQPMALLDGRETSGTHGGTIEADRFSDIGLDSDDHATKYNFAERGLRAEFISLRLYLASTPPRNVLLRGLVAQAEEQAGNTELALAILEGGSADFPVSSSHAPVAASDEFHVREDEELDVDAVMGILGNDVDADGDDLDALLVTGPSNGKLTLQPDGSFAYTPNSDFNGTDVFTYRASDGALDSSEVSVTITVDAINDVPTAASDTYDLLDGTTLEIDVNDGVLANDTDVDGDELTALPRREPSAGTLVLRGDGSFVYTPDDDFRGSDSFTYVVSDGTSVSDEQTVTIRSATVDQPLSLAPIEDVTLLAGSPLHIPLDGFHEEGQAISYTAASDNSLVSTLIPKGNQSMRILVRDFGDMVFELFEQRAPRATEQIIELAEDEFFDNITFHRVIDGFVIQGGDPTGTGTGGSPLGEFDDQFHEDLQHNRTGILSMAKSTDDTNDSQFFIIEGPARALDFNHSIFGQLVEGEEVREAISNVPTGSSDAPLDPVIMESVEIFVDEENGVLMIAAPEGSSSEATITVTATDESGQEFQRSFHVTVVPDSSNGGPFLSDIPEIQTSAGTPAMFQLEANDVEDDPVLFDAVRVGGVDYTLNVDRVTGEVEVTPPDGFTGQFELLVRVRPETSSSTSDLYDSQTVNVTVS